MGGERHGRVSVIRENTLECIQHRVCVCVCVECVCELQLSIHYKYCSEIHSETSCTSNKGQRSPTV